MTGNRKELRRARKIARDAIAMLEAVEALPRRRGQKVRWSNGVVWTRIGDDEWEPTGSDGLPAEDRHYPSEHVAMYGFEPVTERDPS